MILGGVMGGGVMGGGVMGGGRNGRGRYGNKPMKDGLKLLNLSEVWLLALVIVEKLHW